VLETKIQEDLNRDKKNIQIHISAFILSVTPLQEVTKKWGEGVGTTKEQFAENKVLFIDSDKAYLMKIFDNLLPSNENYL
jgi:hypothetical protein